MNVEIEILSTFFDSDINYMVLASCVNSINLMFHLSEFSSAAPDSNDDAAGIVSFSRLACVNLSYIKIKSYFRTDPK